MKTLLSVLLIVAAGFVASCFDDAGAQSGSLAALEARVAALEANPPGDKAYSSDAPAGFAPSAETADARALGTVLGFDSTPQSASKANLRSALGYLYSLQLGGSGKTGPESHVIYYTQANCVDQGYISDISVYGAEQGYVFAVAANGGTTWDNPAQFYYVAAGTPATGPINYVSTWNSLEECTTNSGAIPTGYAVQVNDPAITGVENDGATLPITLR